MLILFAISTLALGMPDYKINENEFEQQYSKKEEEIINRFQNRKMKLQKLLQNQTSLENITKLDLLNHSLNKNSTNHHHHHHHHQQQQNESNKNSQNNQTSVNHKHHCNHMKRKLHRRKHFNHYKKPENQNVSLQNKTSFDEKKINFENNDKISNHKIIRIKKYINKIKQQSKINESDTNNTKSETNQHNIHVDKKLSNELLQKYKKLGQRVHHPNRKQRSHHHAENNEHIPIHKWDENQKKKFQQRLKEFEKEFKNFEIQNDGKEKTENVTQANKIDTKSQKKPINSNSKVNKVLKSNYTIGAVIFVGIIVIILVVVLISKKSNKINDDSNANCQESIEAISNESL